MFFKVKELPKGLFKACVVPRPIAWVSTLNKSGKHNLAPFSFFNIVSENPPMVMFSTTDAHKEGNEKDTLKNVEETGEFVVNITSYNLREKMNITSLDLPRDISEFEFAQIEQKDSIIVKPKLVKDAPISLECIYYQSLQLPTPDTEKFINRMVIGYVVGIHVCSSVIDEDGKINIKKFKPLARMGYQGYIAVDECFDMTRPDLSSLSPL